MQFRVLLDDIVCKYGINGAELRSVSENETISDRPLVVLIKRRYFLRCPKFDVWFLCTDLDLLDV